MCNFWYISKRPHCSCYKSLSLSSLSNCTYLSSVNQKWFSEFSQPSLVSVYFVHIVKLVLTLNMHVIFPTGRQTTNKQTWSHTHTHTQTIIGTRLNTGIITVYGLTWHITCYKVSPWLMKRYHFYIVNLAKWPKMFVIILRGECCSVPTVWVRIPPREEQNIAS